MQARVMPTWLIAVPMGVLIMGALTSCGGSAPPDWVMKGHDALVRDGKNAIYGIGMTKDDNPIPDSLPTLRAMADKRAILEVQSHTSVLLDRIIQEFGLSLTGDPDNQYLMLDTTLVRVHQQAASGKGGAAIRLWGVREGD